MKTFQDYLADIKKQIREVEPAQVQARLSGGEPVVVIDIRESDEWQKGTIPGAIRLPRGMLEVQIEKLCPDRSKPLVLT